MSMTMRRLEQAENRAAPLVRWGPSFAGAITAIAFTAMVMSLWVAIGYGSGVHFFVADLQWFFLGTVLGSLVIGGAVAGFVAALRGATVGIFDGMIVWALVLVAALLLLALGAIAAVAGSTGGTTVAGIRIGDTWALFGALIGGLACAVTGGIIGGGMPRPVATEEPVAATRPAEVRADPRTRRTG